MLPEPHVDVFLRLMDMMAIRDTFSASLLYAVHRQEHITQLGVNATSCSCLDFSKASTSNDLPRHGDFCRGVDSGEALVE